MSKTFIPQRKKVEDGDLLTDPRRLKASRERSKKLAGVRAANKAIKMRKMAGVKLERMYNNTFDIEKELHGAVPDVWKDTEVGRACTEYKQLADDIEETLYNLGIARASASMNKETFAALAEIVGV